MSQNQLINIVDADHVVAQLATMLAQAQLARSKMSKSQSTPVNFVTIKKFSEETGYSVAAVNAKISTGVWLEGKIWWKGPDGRRLINLREYERWATGVLKMS